MRKILIPCVVAAVLVGLFLFLMAFLRPAGRPGDRTAGRDRDLSGQDAATESGESGLEAAADAALSGADEALSRAEAGGPTLHGVVVDDAGRPLPGAVVVLRASDDLFSDEWNRTLLLRDRMLGHGPAAESGLAAKARTDPNGAYAIPIASVRPGTYQVLARHDDHVPQWESWAWVLASTELNFRLGLGDAITGTVLDPEGTPVAGASVEASLEGERRGPPGIGGSNLADRTDTGPDGRFRLGVSGGRYRVSASASGFSAVQADSVDSGTRDLELRLGPGRNLLVAVADEVGEPVGGAMVALFSGDGGFGGPGGFGGRGGPGGFGGRGGEMARGGDRLLRWVRAPERRGATEPDGKIRFDSLPAGGYQVAVEKAGFVPQVSAADLRDGASEPNDSGTTEVSLALDEGRIITGTVTDPDGRPVAGAFVLVGEDRSEEDAQREAERQEFIRRMQEEQARRAAEAEASGEPPGGGPGGGGGRGGGRGGGPPWLAAAMEAETGAARPQPVLIFRTHAATETDRQGRFRFDTLEPGRFSLSVQSDLFLVYRQDGIELADDPVRVDVRLDPGIRLEGRIASSVDSEAVPGAKIKLRWGGGGFGGFGGRGGGPGGFGAQQEERLAQADPEGNFRFGGLVPGRIQEVLVDANGFALLLAENIEITSEPVQKKEFLLDPAASVSGTIVDSRGSPVLNAQVSAVEAPPPAPQEGDDPRAFFQDRRRQFTTAVRGRTDGEGKFHLAEVTPTTSLRIEASHPDFKPFESEAFAVKPGDKITDLRYQLRSGGRLEAWLRDPSGAPVASARVSLELAPTGEEQGGGQPGQDTRGGGRGGRGGRGGPGGFGGFGSVRATGPDGKAVFTALDAGTYRLSSSPRTFQPWFSQVAVADDQTSTAVADLLPENAIAGIVVDLLGQPVPGAGIEASRDGEGGWPRERSWGRSEDDGSYRVGGLADGEYRIVARAEGYAERTLDAVRVNTETRIELQRLGGVSGWVVTAETGQPIPAFSVRLVRAGTQDAGEQGRRGRGPGGRDRRDINDPGGAFAFDNVTPGEYDLQATAQGYSSAQVRIAVQDGMVTEGVRVELLEGLVLAGIVTTDAGAPVAGARLFLLPASNRPAGGSDASGGAAGDVQDRRGARREEMAARRENRGGGEEGRPANASAAPAAAAITAAIRGNSVAVTDETGSFQLKDVPEGSYLLIADHEALVLGMKDVQIREGRFENPIVIQMKRGETLSGTIRLQDGQGAAGATVYVRDDAGVTKRATVDGSGRYVVQGLAKGKQTFYVRGPGQDLRSNRTQITVKAGSNQLDYRYGEEAPRIR